MNSGKSVPSSFRFTVIGPPLSIDPPEGRVRLELDYVYVFNPDGKKIKTWGFGGSGGRPGEAARVEQRTLNLVEY